MLLMIDREHLGLSISERIFEESQTRL
jgi:integrase